MTVRLSLMYPSTMALTRAMSAFVVTPSVGVRKMPGTSITVKLSTDGPDISILRTSALNTLPPLKVGSVLTMTGAFGLGLFPSDA